MADVALSLSCSSSCKQLMLLALCQVILNIFKTDAQSTGSTADVASTSWWPAPWPTGLTNMELWEHFNSLEETIIQGGRLREADLSMRLARIPGMKKDPEEATMMIEGISECKCRVECQADAECAAFVYIGPASGNGTTRCWLYDTRGSVGVETDDPDVFLEFKILSAAVGDICRIDLECSRRTGGATCNRDRSLGGNETGICVCPGDNVPHEGECVDPATLTTTPLPTTTTVAPTTTPAPTTTAEPTEPPTTPTTTTPATTTPAPVAAQSLELDSLTHVAEWPCQSGNNEFCNFQADSPASSAPAHWKAGMETGTCGAEQKCQFHAQRLTSPGAPRIEVWRGVGHFVFDTDLVMAPSPASLPPGQFVAGPNSANETWTYDCSSAPGDNHMIMTGLLGVQRRDKYDKNLPQDVDMMLCTRFTNVHLEVNPSDGNVIDVSSMGTHECAEGYVLTGLYDTARDFLQTKKAKCSRLTSGTVTDQCQLTGKAPASNQYIYWNACDQTSPRVVTGLTLSAVPSSIEQKEWKLKCCTVTGPATSLTTS